MVITRSMLYELHYVEGFGNYKNAQKILWDIQKTVRTIQNKSIREMFLWDFRSEEAKNKTGKYLNLYDETGYKRIDGYVYSMFREEYKELSSFVYLPASSTIPFSKYKQTKSDVLKGVISLPSYKSGQPIPIKADGIKIISDDGYTIRLSLLSKYGAEKIKLNNCKNIIFSLMAKDKKQISILENILSNNYRLGMSQLEYKKKKWFLRLTYSFIPEINELNSNSILGVDLGCRNVIYASSFGNNGSFVIDGGEIQKFANRINNIKKQKLKQCQYCGNGRIGHGSKVRIKSAYKTRDKISNYRELANHRYSKALINYAVKNGYGAIQMEDLTGIKKRDDFSPLLLDWNYCDLQRKIENKANKEGIKIIKINPAYTSQRCSRCGHIDKHNRLSQESFKCTKCGFKSNADYNASQNISINGIEKIIADEINSLNKC